MDIQWIDVKPHPGGLVKLTAVVTGDLSPIAELAYKALQKPYELILKAKSKKRSLTANAYYQVLLDKLSAAVQADRREIHRQMLARYGVTEVNEDGIPVMFSMRSDIDPVELGEMYVDPIDTEGGFTTYRVLKGSSKMNSSEFKCLVDGLISECKELGIETLPDDELARLFEIQKQEDRNA